MTTFPLDILIATHGRSDQLALTLDGIADNLPPGGVRQVVVVENGGRAGAETICAERQHRLPLRYLFVPHAAKARALNEGLRILEPGLVCFFDDDVKLCSSTLAAYAEAAARYGRHHHFGGPVRVDRADAPPALLVPYLPASARGFDQGETEKYYDRPWFIGSNWAAFRDDVIAAGGFSEHLGPGAPGGALGDETDLQIRLREAGHHGIYLPQAVVLHHVPDEVWTLPWVRKRQYRRGVTLSLMGEAGGGRRIAGAPLERWRDCVRYGLRAVAARVIGIYPRRGVDADMKFSESWGAVVGSRLASRMKRHPGS